MAHLFLSHSTADDDVVRELREALADLGLEVWIDSRQLRGGDPLRGEIKAAIEAAAGLAVLISPESLQSRWVGRELRYGLQVQAQRGREGFPVIPLSLNGTRLGVLEDFFTQEPLYIPVTSGAGGAMAASDAILVALGLRLPGERPAQAQPRPEPVEELVLQLSDLGFHENDGVRRPAARARLIYEPASASLRQVVSPRSWRLTAPLGPIEAEVLRWYLERWPLWPNPVLANRARLVEAHLMAWGRALHAAALPPECTTNVLQAWAAVGERASRRFSISLDATPMAGDSEAEHHSAQDAATALLALPWELLHNGEGFLFQGARPTRVRRRLPNIRPSPVPTVAPPIRVLLITARPEDDACGYSDHRASALPLVAATEELGDVLRLTLLHPATYPALEAELARAQQAREPYHVVHFNGHGVYDRRVGLGGLCFEDPNDNHKLTGRRHERVFTDRLGPLLIDCRIPLVVLEACQSAQADAGAESVATELLQRGVASVVAMSHSVLVETARRFVAAFYTELAAGQRVGQAMLAGQRALHRDPSRGQRYGIGELKMADWFVPVLYQDKEDPQLLTATPAPQTREDQRARLRTRLGAVPLEPADTGFVGRSRDLLALERLLRQERWAVVRGQGGEGKTALAAELARWLVRSQQVRRAAFVSVELCSHEDAVLDALGRQLVGADYSVATFASPEQAIPPIERALRERPTLLVFDNMESVLQPSDLETPALLDAEAARELQAIMALAERLLRAGETRMVFTSRETLPPPFAASRQEWELRQLEKGDAVALIERCLAAGDGARGGGGRALAAQREEIEMLVEAVQGHARTLVLLGPELHRRGVAATQAALVELMEQMEHQFPGNRERSLLASVALSLRRLSAANLERARVLAVFHGGVDLNVLAWMTGWSEAEVEALAQELVETGLATPSRYNHLHLNPALCPFLRRGLASQEWLALQAAWRQATERYLQVLVQWRTQNAEDTANLTLLELPNLLALLDQIQATSEIETTIAVTSSLHNLCEVLGKPRLLEHVGMVRDRSIAALEDGWSHAHFEAARTRVEQQLASGDLGDAMQAGERLLAQARATNLAAYELAEYDLAGACWLQTRVLLAVAAYDEALLLAQEGRSLFEAIAKRGTVIGADVMADSCLSEAGSCLMELGRLDEAAATFEDAIRRAKQRGADRAVAVERSKLAMIRLQQKRYPEALSAFSEARDIFLRLKEPYGVCVGWHQIGLVYQDLGQLEAAEEAYRESLTISVQLDLAAAQASTLAQLGDLYTNHLGRPETAVTCHQKAAELYGESGDARRAALQSITLADILRNLNRLEEARHAIRQGIAQISAAPLNMALLASKCWAVLNQIETEAQDRAAAAAARSQAMSFLLAHRRQGGANDIDEGRYAGAVLNDILSRNPATVLPQLQQWSADPEAAEWHPFLRSLQDILSGNRERSFEENPALHFAAATELLLLIELLEQAASGSIASESNGTMSSDR